MATQKMFFSFDTIHIMVLVKIKKLLLKELIRSNCLGCKQGLGCIAVYEGLHTYMILVISVFLV